MSGRQDAAERPFWELLPEIYREDELLNRLTAVLEAPFLENEAFIAGLGELLYTPQNIPEEFLDFVGRMVGLRNDGSLFTPAQMRALIPAAWRLHRRKGTRAALQELLVIYLSELCGHQIKPAIVEQGESAPSRYAGLSPWLKGVDGEVAVIFPPEPALQSREEQGRLEQLVREYTPAWVTPRVVVVPWPPPLGWGYLDESVYL